ncbi:hypothetical protein ONZ51_g12121 [Trametes cubensis]|uniref:Uncharacterized protein n=1 Tax=Trametes cubensis TaxID=1111947 RepID=A0AAD7X5P0_9APHY|nr:hypothetical protein ONZ51_g12121 [Trametes cubensis]
MARDTPILANPGAAAAHSHYDARHYYVVLDRGPDAGVHYDVRPENVAVGRHVEVLPLVIVTPSWREAVQVEQLNTDVISKLGDPIDHDDFAQRIRASHVVQTAYTRDKPIYAFKVAKETGIYLGYDWSFVRGLISFRRACYKKCKTFEEALVWMIEKDSIKPDRNVALPLSLPRFGVPSRVAPATERSTDATVSIPTSIAPTAVEHQGADVKAGQKHVFTCAKDSITLEEVVRGVARVRVGTGATSADTQDDLAQRSVSATTPGQPPDRSPMALGRRFHHAGQGAQTETIVVSHVGGEDACAARPGHIVLDHLRLVIRPLTHVNHLSVLNLGPEVDVWFRAHRIATDMQFFVLRAYVWSEDAKDFIDAVGRPPLELPLVDAEHVWDLLSKWISSL